MLCKVPQENAYQRSAVLASVQESALAPQGVHTAFSPLEAKVETGHSETHASATGSKMEPGKLRECKVY